MERRARASGAARRQNARAEADAAEPRSEAPKSIAGSLMVPADMLDGQPPNRSACHAEPSRPLCSAVRPPRSTARRALSVPAGTRSSSRQPRRAEPRSKPDRWRVISRAARAVVRVDTHAPRLGPLWGPRMVARHLAGAPRLVRRLALGGVRRRDPDHGGDRQPIRHSPFALRTQRARGWAPRRAGDGRPLRVEQPACATGSAARPSTPPRAANPPAPDDTRASTTASGDQACRSRSPVHAVHVKHSLLHPQLDELKLRELGLHAGVLAVHGRRHDEQLELGQQPPGVW